MTNHQLSVERAVAIGTLVVNVPVFTLLLGPIVIAAIFQDRVGSWGSIAFPIGFVLAWAWWSLTVPHWRLWAYQRVASISDLKRKAVSAGLIWPDGSFFARTEIKSKEHAAMEQALERERG